MSILISANWPQEEAEALAKDVIRDWGSGHYTKDELHQFLIRERQHWVKVFGDSPQGLKDMKEFSDTFNDYCFETIGIAI